MFTMICITILAYYIMGKDIRSLLEKIKDVDWQRKAGELFEKLKPYAVKAGRVVSKPLLQFYYVMTDEQTSTLDRVLIYSAIIYTVSPVSLISDTVYKLLGVLDEGAAVLFVYKKVKARITPEIDFKVEQTLNEWLGIQTCESRPDRLLVR